MRVMEIDTPLGPDVLLFHRMRATEEISRLPEYQLELLSPKSDINLDDILGKSVTVKVALPDDRIRHFGGHVIRFVQGGSYGRYFRYSAVVRPWLWFLTRTAIGFRLTVQVELRSSPPRDRPRGVPAWLEGSTEGAAAARNRNQCGPRRVRRSAGIFWARQTPAGDAAPGSWSGRQRAWRPGRRRQALAAPPRRQGACSREVS